MEEEDIRFYLFGCVCVCVLWMGGWVLVKYENNKIVYCRIRKSKQSNRNGGNRHPTPTLKMSRRVTRSASRNRSSTPENYKPDHNFVARASAKLAARVLAPHDVAVRAQRPLSWTVGLFCDTASGVVSVCTMSELVKQAWIEPVSEFSLLCERPAAVGCAAATHVRFCQFTRHTNIHGYY